MKNIKLKNTQEKFNTGKGEEKELL